MFLTTLEGRLARSEQPELEKKFFFAITFFQFEAIRERHFSVEVSKRLIWSKVIC